MGQIADIARSRNLLWNLTLRELRAKYRRSLLGWSWSMLNPLAQLAIYSFVFGVLFGVDAPVGDRSGWQPNWPALQDYRVPFSQAKVVRHGSRATVVFWPSCQSTAARPCEKRVSQGR